MRARAAAQAGEWFVFVHYLSKFMDWFDTLWMILKKKSNVQMSFLHLYHHGGCRRPPRARAREARCLPVGTPSEA